MKLKRLLSLAGILIATLVFTGGRLYATNAVSIIDAQGFPGGTDTVDVYIVTDSAYVSAEIGVGFNMTKLSYVDGSIKVNAAAWAGAAPSVSIDSVNGGISVAFISLDPSVKLAKTSSPLKVFSVVLKVDSAATPGTMTLTPSGRVLTVSDIVNNGDGTVVASLANGTFTILSSYTLSADSVTASLGGGAVGVPIYLENIGNVAGVSFDLNFNASQLSSTGSVVLNDAIWEGGAPSVAVDTSVGGVLGVVILNTAAGKISPKNDATLLATIYLKPASGAVEATSNPLTFTSAFISTVESIVNNTDPSVPNTEPGNVNIRGKFSLKVGSDAAAPLGGSDTVKVYLKNAETLVGVDATLKFDSNKYSAPSESDVIFNTSIFSGAASNVSAGVVVTDSSAEVIGLPLSADSIAAGEGDKLLFSVILTVKATAATGYDSVDASGSVTMRDADYNLLDPIAIGSVTKGAFLIRSPFEFQVQTVYGRAGSTQRVFILLTNRDSITSADVLVKFNSSELSYVANSVMMNDGLWISSAPVPDVQAAGDSVVIGVVDFSNLDLNRMIRSGAGRTFLSLEFTALPVLTNGMSSTISVSGDVAVQSAPGTFDAITVNGISGNFTILEDFTPPGPVSNLTGTVLGNEISLNWTNPGDADLDHITVLRRVSDGTSSTVLSDLTTSFTDTDVTPTSKAYRYVLTAYDQVGNTSDTTSTGWIGTSVTVDRPGLDLNNDGKLNAGDLYYYLANSGSVSMDSLTALIVYLLAEPSPSTLLAASGNGSEMAQPGAAYINLSSDFEAIVARFTFSYNKAYEFSSVALSPALQGKAMIKALDNNGQLVVDVISLTGFVPAEIGGDIFRVMFSNGSYDRAALKLEKVEVADRSGKIYTGEKARIASSAILPKAYALAQNSPNPFNPSTTIAFEIPESNSGTQVVLTVFNIRGQKVVTLVDELKDAGRYSVNWDGRNNAGQSVSSGVYFYRLQAGDFSAVRKMVILK